MRRHESGDVLRRRAVPAALACVVAACSPSLDWRQSRPAGSGATLLFPCRPSAVERPVSIAGQTLRLTLHSCSAGGATFSLAVIDVGAAERVAPVLAALREQAAANVSGQATAVTPVVVAGATANLQSGRVRIDGRLLDGRPVVEHAAFFVRGTRLYQATVIGAREPIGPEALDNFFGAIRVE